MILTLLRYPLRNKLISPSAAVNSTKLVSGEQLLIQTVDKKLTLTTHRLIQKHQFWAGRSTSVMLEDITDWEVKASGNILYLILSVLAAFMVYFDDAFALIAGFFTMLYIMTRRNYVHVTTPEQVMVLSLDLQHSNAINLADMVRQAKKNRMRQIKFEAQSSSKVAA